MVAASIAAYARKPIPKALRQQVWVKYNGHVFDAKCHIKWCENMLTPFNFEAGHNIPDSKGGPTTIENLLPICSSCNRSMSNNYTIDEFNQLGTGAGPKRQNRKLSTLQEMIARGTRESQAPYEQPQRTCALRLLCCFRARESSPLPPFAE